MADELSVVVKTKLEVDKQQARQEINSFGEEYSNSNKKSIKLPVDIDKKASKSNISAAIPSLAQSIANKPIKAVIGIDEAASLKNIHAAITSLQEKLKKKELKIDLGVGFATGSSSKKSSKSSKTSIGGVDFKEIAGAQKYVDKLVEKAKDFEKSFKDATAQIASTDIAYKPLEKMWQATVKYEDSIGRTTSMMFSMNEGMEEVHVTQLKLTENEKKYRAEVEKTRKVREAEMNKTLNYLNNQESAYNNLFSKAFNQKNKLSDDSGAPDSFGLVAQNALNLYKSQIDEIRNQGTAITAEQKRNLEKLRADAKRIIIEQQNAKWGATDFASKDVSKQIELEQKRLKTLIREYDNAGMSLVASVKRLNALDLSWGDISDIDKLNKWREDLKLAKADIDDFFSTANGKAFQTSVDISDNQLGQINRFLSEDAIRKGDTDGIVRLRKELETLKSKYESIRIALSEPVTKGTDLNPADIKKYNDELAAADQRLASAARQAKLFNGSIASNDALDKAHAQIEKLKNDLGTMEINWSKALEIPELKADINAMHAALENADAANLPNLQKAFTELRSKIKAAGADCKSFGDRMAEAFSKVKDYFSVVEIFQRAKEFTAEIVDNVKEVNTAMTELKKVTELTKAGYDQFTKEAASRAKDIGTDLVDYIAGTADFARLGYNAVDAQTLSESTNILYKVGDGLTNIEQASDAVIASMAAYELQVSDVTAIVDMFNEVSNKTSIDTAGLTDAITRSAAALSVSGLNLEKSMALIVAGNETVRDASMTGNALKSLSMRIRGAESDLKAAGEETDEYTASTSKLREEIKALTTVDIMKNDNEFKDLYDIMDEISKEYSKLTDIGRANVTEILFGKQRASVGASILLNFDKAEEALRAAQKSTGSAMKEHDRWAQSIEASEARAAAAFQEFSVTVMNSDLIKGAYDAQTGILGFLTNVIDKLGAIPALAATVAGALSFKNIGISNMNMPYPTCHGAVA